MTRTPVFRFAPSPNGYLHLGHVRSALVGSALARATGGRFLLRIEDIDPTRAREVHVEAILEDLARLGLTWEQPVLRQSRHFDVYRDMAARLEAMGLLYPCFATRQEIALAVRDAGATDPDGAPLYPGIWKGRPGAEIAERRMRGEPFALRIDMERALKAAGARLKGRPLVFREIAADGSVRPVPAQPGRWGDAVIVRKEFPASYHLAVVTDDHRQGMTHVTRGMDLFAATDLHRLLQVLLDLDEPLYHHHPLMLGADGRKLSKSEGATAIKMLHRQGINPDEVRRRAMQDCPLPRLAVC